MTDYLNCVPEILHTGPAKTWTVQVAPLVAPGVFAITDSWSGTAREAYRKGRRVARISLRHCPAALKPGRRTMTLIYINRGDKFFAADSVRAP